MNARTLEVSGHLVDVLAGRIFPGSMVVAGGKIKSITERTDVADTYLLPGFIDAHVHIESSMLMPREFARAAVLHGTVATVSDPHEIGNVLGVAGVQWMLENAAGVPFKFYFGAPACVPATPFETAGAEISAAEVARLLDDPRIQYLSEMMNFPGVLAGDEQVLAKIAAARKRQRPVDGHAPGLRGELARQYFAAGISTDHECVTRDEALDKLNAGANILIREGSAARNFEALFTLIDEFPHDCMFCSDDKHPDELLTGHINDLVQRAILGGTDPMNVLRAACVNPVKHYGLDVGLLQVGDDADFIEVDDLHNFKVLRTFVRGKLVADNGMRLIDSAACQPINQFGVSPMQVEQFACPTARADVKINVIEAFDGQLITRLRRTAAKIVGGVVVSDIDQDILKLTVVNRYRPATPAVAFISNFGLRRGAIASSVAHDSHNVVAVGVSDQDLCAAVNLVIETQGGLAVVADGVREVLPLPIAGLMANDTCNRVGAAYAGLDQLAKQLGSPLQAPFMTLSFMALLVIPDIKLSDQGLFDVNRFELMPLFPED